MTRPLLGLVGKKRSGKDTFAGRLVEEHGFTRLAFADKLKAVAYDANPTIGYTFDRTFPELGLARAVDQFGWEFVKDNFPEARRFLKDLGVAVRVHIGTDTWLDVVRQQALDTAGPIVVTDVRFPNEALAVEQLGGKLIRIDRPSVKNDDTHESETALDNWGTDYHVSNDDSPDFYRHADSIARHELYPTPF